MAATIETQTIGGVVDRCLVLSNSQFGRPHGYGDSWNTLRVALSFNIEVGADPIKNSVFRAGLCSGTVNMPADATTANSYGIKVVSVLAAPFSRIFSTYPYYQNAVLTAFSRVGVVETTASTNIVTGWHWSTVGNTRSMLFIDIIKGSPNYTFKVFRRAGYAATDSTPAAFLATVTQPAPVYDTHLYSSPTGTALPINTGANGILDTVYVGWNLVAPRLFISDLAVVRLA